MAGKARLLYRLLTGSALSLACATGMAQEQGEASAYATDQSGVASPEPGRLGSTASAENAVLNEKTEILTERYPSRAVKIERRVMQDEEGNYMNHGLWTYWNPRGEVIASGDFKYGKRHGKWVRWHEASEPTTFAAYKQFQAPFASEAHFVDGELHGTWVCYDAKNRKVCSFDFVDGQLHGKALWYFPTGHKRLEADYTHGRLDGLVMEWTLEERSVQQPGPNGTKRPPQREVVAKLTSKMLVDEGRKQVPHVEFYAPNIKKVEGAYLAPADDAVVSYDWWAGVIKLESETKTAAKDKGQKHGLWTGWYKDGNKHWQGEYQHGQPVGTHVWWHPNGQKHIEGHFQQGEEAGKWTWWYSNGQKQVQGEYAHGDQTGVWTRWDQQGQVVEVERFTPGEVLKQPPQIAVENAPKQPARLPVVELEANKKSSSSRRPRTPLRR